MWELDYRESWVQKNWCFWTVVLEKTLESPLDCKEIQLVHSKGDQSWVFIGGTDVEAETPILWPSDAESWLIWKDPDAGKDWGQEDEMVGWHHRHNGHGFGWTPWVGDGQVGLACCSSWGCKESDMTEWSNWTELNWIKIYSPRYFFLLKLVICFPFPHCPGESLFLFLPGAVKARFPKIVSVLWDASWFGLSLSCCEHKRLFYFLSLYLIICPTFCPVWDTYHRYLPVCSPEFFQGFPCFLKQ